MCMYLASTWHIIKGISLNSIGMDFLEPQRFTELLKSLDHQEIQFLKCNIFDLTYLFEIMCLCDMDVQLNATSRL